MKFGCLIFLLFSITLSGQDFFDLHPEILNFTSEIDSSLNDFRKVSLENEEILLDMTDGGGSLIGYYENRKIMKIEMWAGLSYATITRNFYFRNNELYFVEEEKNQFYFDSKSGNMDYSKTELVFWGRYLFEPKFDLMTHGHDHIADEINDMEIFLRKESLRLVELLAESDK